MLRHWESDHRTWAQRGGYGGYYIPQDRFSLYFGSQHWFRMHSRPTIYMGYPRFSYGGFSFLLVDPWPEYWAENWYDTDDVYIDYDDGYYLYNRRYPGVRTCDHRRHVADERRITNASQTERHRTGRVGWLRAAVLGANDGILSTASLVLGVAAAHATHSNVMVAGVAGLVAGAMSMAAGEYVSVHSQADTEQADLKLERAELKTDDAGRAQGTDGDLRRSRARSRARQTGCRPTDGP